MLCYTRLLCALVAACCCCLLTAPASAQSSSGACCLPNGSCVVLDQCSCDMQGGAFIGGGISCVGINCSVYTFGACCTNTGCTVTIASTCAAIPGGFASGQSCPIAGCPPGMVACCCGSACFLVDRTFCSHQGGAATGQTSCQPSPCPGACCDLAGNCSLSVTAAQCQGQFLGTGATCNPNPCPGACCDAAGNCTMSSVTACQGTYFPGTTCQPNPCPPKVCCDPQTGACQTVQPCPAGSTQVVGPCTATLCPVPQFAGVCCDNLGNCIPWVAGTPCNGMIITTTTSCSPNPCHPIVCCDPQSGACVAVVPCPTGWSMATGPCAPQNPCPPTQGVCCDLQNNCFPLAIGVPCNGTIFPNQTSCQPSPCPQIVCCTSTGGCTLVSSATQCTGQLFPNLSSCLPNPCVTTACCDPLSGQCQNISPCPPGWITVQGPCSATTNCGPTGVCCTTAGQCFPITPATPCNGTVFPNLSSCTPNPCIPNGACCQPCTGACQTTTAANCPSPYTFLPGAPCQPTVCPTSPVFGACCLNGNCIQATTCDCILKGGTFSGQVPCNPAQCVQDRPGACCNPATNSCSVLSAGTCNQIGGTQFAAGQPCTALPNCSGPQQVCCCCGLCRILDAQACNLAGGTVATGTTCTPLSCFPGGGACCNPATGNCFVVASANQCAAPLVFFAGQPCTPPGCAQTGSCCDTCTGTCTVVTGMACPTQLQVYTAGGTCQPPQVCLPTCGACCTVTPTGVIVCSIVQSQAACAGMWQGVGSTCTPNPCIPPSVTCCNIQTGACQTFGGTNSCPAGWFGNFSSCNPNPCPPFGACCLNGSTTCTQTMQSGCTNGQWAQGQPCNPNPCIHVCCSNATGACGTLPFNVPCPTNSTAFAGTTCQPSPCPPLAACCIYGTIICTTTFQQNCTNGLWIPGTSCNPNPCVKACCNPNTGGCFQVFGGNNCPAGATPVITGVTCTPNPCPPVAPCCLQPNGCIITTANICGSGPFPGVWGPVGGSCNIVCSRACCNNTTGACTTTGVFGVCPFNSTPVGYVCTPSPCPPLGRCCTFPSGCSVTLQANCNGIWGPAGSTCTTSPCVHLCCNTQSGACIVAPIFAFCFGPYTHIAGSTCTPNPCPPVIRACCLPTGACTTTSITSCALLGGTFQPTLTSCAGVVCRGACCLPPVVSAYGGTTGTHCVLTTLNGCQGNWHGYGSSCTTPPTNPINLTTCCPANVNHVNGLNVQDIFDFITAWFNGCSGQPGPPCNTVIADFNGDSVINVQDIFAFLAAWFTGCS